MWHKVDFWVKFKRFESKIFLLSWTLCHTTFKEHRERENSWINTFLKCNSAMWNANSHIQDMNSDHSVHFHWWYPLHHEHLQIYTYISLYLSIYLSIYVFLSLSLYIYIYIYILYQSEVFGHLAKILISHPEIVIFNETS